MNQRGVTLIELLVVVALLGIILAVTGDMLISVVRGSGKAQVLSDMEQQVNFINLKLSNELRSAQSVTPTTGSNTLSFVDTVGNYISYSVTNGALYRTKNGTSYYLHNTNPTDGIYINCNNCFIATSGKPQVVSYDMLVTTQIQHSGTSGSGALSASNSGTLHLSNTLVIKNSY